MKVDKVGERQKEFCSGNAGNGTSTKMRSHRRGADSLKKEQGIGFSIEIDGWTYKWASTRNGFCISDRNDSQAKFEASTALSRRIPDTRCLSLSAAATSFLVKVF